MFLCSRSFRWTWIRFWQMVFAAQFLLLISSSTSIAGAPDFDGNGYVDPRDFRYFEICLSLSGPGVRSPFSECRTVFDADGDEDVDLSDFAAFQRARGHLPIPLRDTLGNAISVGSTAPYSGRQTCAGSCHAHDMTRITNGFHFQQGRTDRFGNVDMKDDYFSDGRTWERSGGRFGRWSGAGAKQTAPKQAENESQIDTTSFEWIRTCSSCHVGGGPGEFDRDNLLLYDESTGQFGYERLGLTADDVMFDGDYSVVDPASGALTLAPWNITGLSGPDCLTCHRSDRVGLGTTDMNRKWRADTLATGRNLTDTQGNPVPAFAAAGTAGQGWFSGSPPTTADPKLQIDYEVGISDTSLVLTGDGNISLAPKSVSATPADRVCWGCHRQNTSTHGEAWFDERDVHFRKFNKRNDDDLTNDVPIYESKACNYCHPGNLEHNFAKGNSLQIQFRNDLDYAGFRTCRNCHLTDLPNGSPNPLRHPDAPHVPGGVMAHNEGRMMDLLSCQACHLPYRLVPGLLFIETTIGDRGPTGKYLSADPLDPTNPDKSRWYSALQKKRDSDGVERWFPCVFWISMYWADWDRKETPDDFSDDTFAPIIQWRLRQAVGSAPLPVVTDDNGDGQKEINRAEEILAYINALRAPDSYGRPIAVNPVHVKGKRIWFADPASPDGVNSIEHEGTGLPVRWDSYTWGLDHNALAKDQSLGYSAVNPELGCRDCHRPDTLDSPVFDRLVLVDPYGLDGQPVYETVRAMTGLNPP